jgi:ABC-type multidrug transport system fused ATPase/permease subunit
VLVVKTLGRVSRDSGCSANGLRDERVRWDKSGDVRRSDALPTLAIALLLAAGAWRVSTGDITLGDLIGFVALFQLLAWPMRFIGWILAELQRAVVGYDRIEEVFREPVTVTPVREGTPMPESLGCTCTTCGSVRAIFPCSRGDVRGRTQRVRRDRRPDRCRKARSQLMVRLVGPPGT